jgi:hypothetical protein
LIVQLVNNAHMLSDAFWWYLPSSHTSISDGGGSTVFHRRRAVTCLSTSLPIASNSSSIWEVSQVSDAFWWRLPSFRSLSGGVGGGSAILHRSSSTSS